MARSPIADTYPPVVRCVVCDAPMRRFDLDKHLRDCLIIEAGAARPLIPEPGDLLQAARRRRGI